MNFKKKKNSYVVCQKLAKTFVENRQMDFLEGIFLLYSSKKSLVPFLAKYDRHNISFVTYGSYQPT